MRRTRLDERSVLKHWSKHWSNTTLTTPVGSAFWPDRSPIWNLAFKYSFCFAENRVLRIQEHFRAYPIGRDGAGTVWESSAFPS